MIKYLRRHESAIQHLLAASIDVAELERWRHTHARKLAYLQHERGMHLVVTMFCTLFFLLSLAWLLTTFSWPMCSLCSVLLALVLAYMWHYYQLENGVQRYYTLADALEEKVAMQQANHKTLL